ncbi:M48 family metallopeptidase [Nanoarchaeota archaeon]
MGIKHKTPTFEFYYSLFMLVFGIGVIAVFLCSFVIFLYIMGFWVLFFYIPLIIGIFSGLFGGEKSYEEDLPKRDQHKLNAIIDEIAKKVNIRKPHKIMLTEGSGVAVTGFFRKKLIIGMAAIKCMDKKDLEAIIAHEYGHFANKDTIFGYLTYRIQRFIEIQQKAALDSMHWHLFTLVFALPTFFFFWLVSKYYSIVTLWYSRRVEYRADRFAADVVGEAQFANSLMKYCMLTDIFETMTPQYILHFLEQGKALINVYDAIYSLYAVEDNLDKAYHKVMLEESSWWSSHPSISERLEKLAIKKVDVKIPKKNTILLTDQLKFEKEASELLTHKWMLYAHIASAQQEEDE